MVLTRPLGQDGADAAGLYLKRIKRVYLSDYLVIFWLQKLFAQGQSAVFDLGGHIGIGYYGYQRYLDPGGHPKCSTYGHPNCSTLAAVI